MQSLSALKFLCFTVPSQFARRVKNRQQSLDDLRAAAMVDIGKSNSLTEFRATQGTTQGVFLFCDLWRSTSTQLYESRSRCKEAGIRMTCDLLRTPGGSIQSSCSRLTPAWLTTGCDSRLGVRTQRWGLFSPCQGLTGLFQLWWYSLRWIKKTYCMSNMMFYFFYIYILAVTLWGLWKFIPNESHL